ncbi:MAG TPA: ABC transporter substrate-binding protein [Malonomonas sp.]
MKQILLSSLLVFSLLMPALAIPQPQAQVEKMINSVLEVLQQKDLSVEAKRAQVSGRIQQYLNMASMAQRTLGDYWNDATPAQRQYFSDLFVQVLEGTYLNRINDYSGGSVQYLQQRVKDNKAIIDTKFVSADLEIPVQYKMIYENDSWQVFDVVIEGVSLIRNYRSSYGEIIRKNGYDGLFALMEEKVAGMRLQ